jgi:hypothetical protein
VRCESVRHAKAWLGVPMAQRQAVFPNIANFSAPTVGFMGP